MKCPINSQSTTPDIEPPQGSRVKAAVLKFYEELASVRGVVSEAQEFETTFSQQFASLAASMSSIPLLKNYSRLESAAASWFGAKSLLWQAVNLYQTDAGSIRTLLLERARIAANLIEGAAVYKSLPTIRRLYEELEIALPSLDKVKLQELLHDHVVIGQFPKLLNIYDSPVAKEILRLRYMSHTKKLTDLGISDADISKLDELAGEMSANLDKARMMAGKFGMDIKQLQNGGYFPLRATDELKRFLEKNSEGAFSSESKVVFDAAGVLNDSRTSSIPAVLNLSKSAKVLGVTELELAGMLGDTNAISKLLRDRFTKDQLDTLFENGTLMQLPALSDELVSFFSESLDLPLANMAEAIMIDPVKAISDYSRQLKQAVVNSSYVQTMLEEGVKQGWVVDELSLTNLPNSRDYIKVASNALMSELFTSTKLRDQIANAYVHRTVSDQVTSLLTMNTSFEQLGLVGRAWQSVIKVTGFLKNSLIVGTGGLPYLGRVFIQNAVSLNAATGTRGMAHYGQALIDMTRAWQKKDTSFLSDIQSLTIGNQKYSLRELFEQTFVTRASNFSSIAGETVQASAWQRMRDKTNPDSLRRFLKFSELYNERFGSPMTGQMLDKAAFAAELISDAFKATYETIASGNQFMDFAARWTAVRALAENPSYAGKKAWENLNELLTYTDEYFNIQEDVGSVGKALAQGFIPFASFALVAPGSALRHAIRHPWRYARMLMLYSQAQAANGQNLTDAEIAQWQKDSYPLFLGRNEKGELWGINPGTVDFYLDTTTWMRENFEKVGRSQGLSVGSTKEQYESKLDPGEDLRKAFVDFSSKFYFTDALLAAVGGIDPFTKDKFADVPEEDALLGFGVNRRTRSILVETLPLLRSLDRMLPTSIVGSQADVDVNYNVLNEAVPTFTGAVPTTGGNKLKDAPVGVSLPQRKEDIIAWVAATGGLTISEIDPNRNVLSSYGQLSAIQSDITKSLGKIDEVLNSRPNVPNRASLQEKRFRLLQISGSLELQKALINDVARKKNYTPPEALEYVRQKIRTANDIPNEALIEYLRRGQP